ncbi:helix-turn-helix domain-containing protein [Streptomyces sp. NPDC054841]
MIKLGIATALLEAPSFLASAHLTDVDDPSDVHSLIRQGQVELVILDPTQPTLNAGLALCRELKGHSRPPSVLAFCQGVTPRDVLLSQLSGIDSFVHANEYPDRLATAVQSTLSGSREWLIGPLEGPSLPSAEELSLLTPREQEVLWLLAERCTNKQIACLLSISSNTVKNHVAAVLRKLSVRHRSELFAEISLPAQQRYARR